MSIAILTEIWKAPPCSGGNLLVLLAIADNANEDTWACFPSVKTIARKSAMSERNTQYCIRDLEEAGLISIREDAGKSSTYVVTCCGSPFAEGGANFAPVQDATKGVQNRAKRGAAGCTLTLREPSLTLGGKISRSQKREPSGYVYDKRLSYGENHALEQAFIAQKVAAE
jgi:hypothetical protein